MDLRDLVKIDNNYTLSDLFKLLKKVIMQDTHVATLALYSSTVQEYNQSLGYGIIEACPFPLKENQENYTITCFVLDNRVLVKDQILTILYTDLVFIDNLQTNQYEPLKVKDQTLHSMRSGVVINDNPLTIVPDTENKHITITYNGQSYKVKIED